MRQLLGAACMLALMVAGRGWADTRVNETKGATEHGVVTIRNVNGSVHVTGWSRKEVQVQGTLGPAVEKLDFESEGDRTRIDVEVPDRVRDGKTIESHLEVSVPKGSDVRVEGVNCEITVGSVDGELDLQSVNGNVTALGQPDAVEVATVNGSINLNAGLHKTHLEAVNGTIEVTGGKGDLEASCVNGHIEVRDGSFDEAKCSTVSGDLEWKAALTSRASLSLQTHSGSIIFEAPRAIGAEFDVSTFSGHIDNEFGPEARRTSEYGPGYEVHFEIGSGDAKIEISSFSGNVTIRGK